MDQALGERDVAGVARAGGQVSGEVGRRLQWSTELEMAAAMANTALWALCGGLEGVEQDKGGQGEAEIWQETFCADKQTVDHAQSADAFKQTRQASGCDE